MSAKHDEKPAQRLEVDLRLIREKRGVSVEEIHQQTRIPIEVIRQFERSGLTKEPQFNEVYLRAFIRTYADLVGISADDAMEALDRSLKGRYDGSLAVEYLGVTPPEKPVPPPDAPIGDMSTQPVTRNVQHEDLPLYEATSEPTVNWRLIGLIVLCLLVLVAAIFLVLRWRVATPPVNVQQQSLPAESSMSVPLPDTLQLTIIADGGPLNPVHVQVDDGVMSTYRLQQGESRSFRAASQFIVAGAVGHSTVLIEGTPWLDSSPVTGDTLVLSREAIQRELFSQRATPGASAGADP